MDRRGAICSFEGIPPGILPCPHSRDRPSPTKGILKPDCPADEDSRRLNLEHLKWVKKEECRLAKHAFTSFPVHAVRPSISHGPRTDSYNVQMPDKQKKVAPSIWDEIYLLEREWDAQLQHETESDIASLYDRKREMMANISKETFVAAMRIAELVSNSSPSLNLSPTETPISTHKHSRPTKKVRIIIHSSDETQIHGPFLPSTDVPNYSEATVYISGRMSEQDPDFEPPLSHRLRREYREYSADEPEYPVYALPKRLPSWGQEYRMPSLNTRKEMLRRRHETGSDADLFFDGMASADYRPSSYPARYMRDMERRYPLADLGFFEYRGRDTVLASCRLKYAPGTSPGMREAWGVVSSRASIPGWIRELHERSLED